MRQHYSYSTVGERVDAERRRRDEVIRRSINCLSEPASRERNELMSDKQAAHKVQRGGGGLQVVCVCVCVRALLDADAVCLQQRY